MSARATLYTLQYSPVLAHTFEGRLASDAIEEVFRHVGAVADTVL